MGLLQKAVETYDAHESVAGEVEENKQPLAPISHDVKRADIQITLDAQGCLRDIEKVGEKAPKIIIPVTEESAGRSGKKAKENPLPLCEQLKYISGKDTEGFVHYIKQLQDWASSPFSHPILKAVLIYVQQRTILKDLAECKIETSSNSDKWLVCWRVIGIGEESGPCWTNQKLFDCFIGWYKSKRENNDNYANGLCMATGKSSVLANKHLKGIVAKYGNAKLISSNDNDNFTYRGRFASSDQAVTVGYEASQKVHNALKWLVANQGVEFGGRNKGGKKQKVRVFICWNPQGKSVPSPELPLMGRECDVTPTDYWNQLRRTLNGLQSELPNDAGVVIAAFDAATDGRLALTYYNELLYSDFLQRLYDWDEHCCWWGWNPEARQYDVVQSPYLFWIVNYAFGTQEKTGDKYTISANDKIVVQQMQRLISCRIDGARFPTDIKQSLVNRASTPQSFDPEVYRKLLTAACAVIRKWHYDYLKEDLKMMLDKERQDRSYQFGRLLAVLEKVERDTYDRDEKREPCAKRLQSRFSRQPLSTFRNMEEQLQRAYFPKLKPGSRGFYNSLIEEIVGHICSASEHELNRPLEDTYLIGYYLQRSELYKKHEAKQQQQEETNKQKEI